MSDRSILNPVNDRAGSAVETGQGAILLVEDDPQHIDIEPRRSGIEKPGIWLRRGPFASRTRRTHVIS
jgi:hypothetical protein